MHQTSNKKVVYAVSAVLILLSSAVVTYAILRVVSPHSRTQSELFTKTTGRETKDSGANLHVLIPKSWQTISSKDDFDFKAPSGWKKIADSDSTFNEYRTEADTYGVSAIATADSPQITIGKSSLTNSTDKEKFFEQFNGPAYKSVQTYMINDAEWTQIDASNARILMHWIGREAIFLSVYGDDENDLNSYTDAYLQPIAASVNNP